MRSISALAHAAGGHRRRADADAGGDQRRVRVEGDGVLVDRDARPRSSAFSATLPVRPRAATSSRKTWLSVPPETMRKPRSASRAASRAALATICRW